jgi:hypothetical protein
MQRDERGSRASGSAEIAAPPATCRRQAQVIETLARAVGTCGSQSTH